MSSYNNLIRNMIDDALLSVHTAFCARVLSVSGDTAKIQPLAMVKAKAGSPKQQTPLSNVPILQNARKWKEKQLPTTGSDHTHYTKVWQPVKPEPGDIVYCLCADRDITETKKGNSALPVLGHHSLSDAVIVGVF